VVERHKQRVEAGVAGRPLRWRGASMARCRTASGLRAGIPRPCRSKALRSDGQVVPSSAAAALTLPSRSASWKARSAWARSARKRLGCQPRWLCRDGGRPGGSPGAPAHAARSSVW
jgi:hypothetical protein